LGLSKQKGRVVEFYSDAIIKDGDVYDTVSVFDTPPLHTKIDMFGGSVIGLWTHDSSTFNMHAGSWGSILDWGWGGIDDSSTVNIFGGSINLSSIGIGGTLNLYGGNIRGQITGFSQSGKANIYGYGFSYDGWTLQGFLSDGSSFNFIELRDNDFAHVNLFVIPEPATLFLLGIGSLLARIIEVNNFEREENENENQNSNFGNIIMYLSGEGGFGIRERP
jgi:hypothetical protein